MAPAYADLHAARQDDEGGARWTLVSYARLGEKGSGYTDAAQIAGALTSRQLKVKQKSNNLAGLQLADLVAHPSRNEILSENGHDVTVAPFATKVIAILQSKYDRRGERVFGKKMLQAAKGGLAAPSMAFAIHLQMTGLSRLRLGGCAVDQRTRAARPAPFPGARRASGWWAFQEARRVGR